MIDRDIHPVLRLAFRLVVVAGERAGADGKLGNLLASMPRQGAPARFWLRCHGMSQRKLEELRARPDVAHVSSLPIAGSLGDTRNAVLMHAMENAGPNDIIGFPEVDAVYADGTLKAVARMFAMAPRTDFVFGVEEKAASIAGIHHEIMEADRDLCEDYGRTSTIFVRSSALERIRDVDGRCFGVKANGRKIKDDNLAVALYDAGCAGVGLPNLKIGRVSQGGSAGGLFARLSALIGS